MAEYIEREKLIKDLKNNADYKSECGFKKDIDIESLISYLKKLPSANVVKVVRCKNCKHCDFFYPIKEKGKEAISTFYCKLLKSDRKETDYCSFGELKEREG